MFIKCWEGTGHQHGRTLRDCCHSNIIPHKTGTDGTGEIKMEWINFNKGKPSKHSSFSSMNLTDKSVVTFVTTSCIYSLVCASGWLIVPCRCCRHHTRSPAGGPRELAADLKGSRIPQTHHALDPDVSSNMFRYTKVCERWLFCSNHMNCTTNTSDGVWLQWRLNMNVELMFWRCSTHRNPFYCRVVHVLLGGHRQLCSLSSCSFWMIPL